MTHFFQRTALVLMATSALCAGPAAARTHHHHAAKPAPPPVAANGKIVTVAGERAAYVVKKGDTLDKIADKLDTSVAELKKTNKLKGNTIQPGDVLKGPPVTKKAYVVAKGDTVFSIAQRFHVSVEELRDENDLSAKVHIRPGQKIRLPADYKAPAVLVAQDEADNGEAPAKGAKGAKGKKGKPAPEPADETPAAGPVGEPQPGAQGRIATEQGHTVTYRVRRGDTLNIVADKLGTSAAELRRDNHIRGNAIRPGQILHGPRTAGATYYAVASGDTLAGVAARLGVSVEALKAANDLGSRTTLRGGQKLKLPGGVHAEAASSRPEGRYPRPALPSREDNTAPVLPARPMPYSGNPTAPIPAQRPYAPPAGSAAGGPAATPTQAAPPSDAQIAMLGKGRFQWPLKGDLISDFGAKPGGQRNDGINIRAAAGDAVHASADGDVVYAGDQVPGFGNLVLIKHADGWVTAYGHLSRVDVKMQQKVTQGQQIGQAGQTGGVPEPQLHFEVRYAPNPLAGDRARPVDPKLVLPK